jgi:2'-5' RNA ligase
METGQMPGYRLNEYIIVLSPHEELSHRILSLRMELNHTYRYVFSTSLKPHVLLVKFRNLALAEERMVQRVQQIAMGLAPFKVELKDFGSHPSHSIFMNVSTRIPILQAVKELKQAQHIMQLNAEHKPHFIEEPCIMLAHKLKNWQYEKAWSDFSQRHFSGRFIADSLLLLKRPEGNQRYQIVRRMEFMNVPVAVRQGELFCC